MSKRKAPEPTPTPAAGVAGAPASASPSSSSSSSSSSSAPLDRSDEPREGDVAREFFMRLKGEPVPLVEHKGAASSASAGVAGAAATGEKPLKFEITARWNKARVGKLTLPHGVVDTPVFMPVGTQGTIKGLSSAQVDEIGCQIILSNTYHLGLRPGTDLIDELGGLHKFMNWKRNLLTDSGGFQMVSLFDLAEFTEEGVLFQSPVDGSQLLLTPELSIHYQNQIGADIMMALDDVVSATTVGPRVEEAMHRTLRWIDRCIKAHKKPHVQNLFGIVQGGLDPRLRAYCLREMIRRSDSLPGFAIGGMAGGEDKWHFWRTVHQCTGYNPKAFPPLLPAVPAPPINPLGSPTDKHGWNGITCNDPVPSPDPLGVTADEIERGPGLPEGKPRYLMGVGYPLDLVVCVALGVDMFDCVWPCRTARFGTAIVPSGLLQLRRSRYASDFSPIDADCTCAVCRTYTRAYLHTLITKEPVGCHLLTQHNIHHMMQLMRSMRAAITAGTFPEFVLAFLARHFPDGNNPRWVVDALRAAGIDLPMPTGAPPPPPESKEADE